MEQYVLDCMTHTQPCAAPRPKLLLIFLGASAISLISSFSLLAAAVIIH
jgi:hypothetical protein